MTALLLPTIRSLGTWVETWATRYGLLDPSAPEAASVKAHVIATFVVHCSPEGALARDQRLAAQATAVFFYLDDLPRAEVEDAVGCMLSVLRAPRTGGEPSDTATTNQGLRPHDALKVILQEVEEFDPRGSFRAQFVPFMEALMAESVRVQQGPFTLDDYATYRIPVIFVREYVWIWLLALGVDPSPTEASMFEPILSVSSEIVAIINDLASLDRERASGGVDANLVLLTEQAGHAAAEALDLVEQRHEVLSAQYLEHRDVLFSSGSPSFATVAHVVDAVVHGNFSATVALSEARYPQCVSRLRRLRLYGA